MDAPAKLALTDVVVRYGAQVAVRGVSMQIARGKVTAFIGPSGCGKSTLLRSLNRMNDTIPGCVVTGRIELDGQDVYAPGQDVPALRRRVGLVFQRSNPFPMSIFDNVAYGLRVGGIRDRAELDRRVRSALEDVALLGEVERRLHDSALDLSGGQQQRLCIARALAVGPEVLLMDEPASALDPMSTAKVETIIERLRGEHTIVIVTHNLAQARRVSDDTAFLYLGEVVEMGPTAEVFEDAKIRRTRDYVSGKFG